MFALPFPSIGTPYWGYAPHLHTYVVLVCGVCMSVGDRGIVSCFWRNYLMYPWGAVSMRKPEVFFQSTEWLSVLVSFCCYDNFLKQLRGGRLYFSLQVTLVCPSMREVMMGTWSQACCGHGIPQWGPEGVAQWYKPTNRQTDRHNLKKSWRKRQNSNILKYFYLVYVCPCTNTKHACTWWSDGSLWQ